MPLRLWWDEDKMMFHQVVAQAAPAAGQRERPSARSTAAIRKITPIVKSVVCWSYTFMLRTTGMVVKDFELYCYSCNCHPERPASLYNLDERES